MRVFLTALLPLVAASSVRFPVVQDDIKFNSVNSIKASQVGDVLSALNGYTVHSSDAWKGIRSYNPIRHPVFFLIANFEMPQNFPELTMNSNLHFDLENDNNLDDEFNEFSTRSANRWPDAAAKMISIDVAGDKSQERLKEAIGTLRDENFDQSNDSDRAFMLEYTMFNNIIDEIPKYPMNEVPSTVYWINLNSVRRLAADYGTKHEKPLRAAQLLSELVGKATGRLESHPRSLFMVIQETVEGKTRSRRQAEAKPSAEKAASGVAWNAYEYDSDFSTVFAMSLFTMLIITLGVYATSIGLWFMDPGRDSIIYRMTSQRMKME
ncbi:renin receptor [Galendromus occidentalis]|uniref:Renin receptor n=1 Tax=Galendromus occidentalis TaxID=34638 RepID=A0AAJ6QVK0_9ACAR|nr:renin receptor [Galendromus occidentalis]